MAQVQDPRHQGRLTAVVPLRHADRDAAAALVARAFQHDPVWETLLPDPEQRARVLRWLTALALSSAHDVQVIGSPLRGVASWMPPGLRDSRPPIGLLALPFRAGTALPRLLRYMRSSQELLEELGGKEIWRLTGLAVEPAEQGRGVGSSLLRAGLERADADGRPVGLVTDNPRNLPFYERHGFEIAAQRELSFGPHTSWGLRRGAGG